MIIMVFVVFLSERTLTIRTPITSKHKNSKRHENQTGLGSEQANKGIRDVSRRIPLNAEGLRTFFSPQFGSFKIFSIS